MPGLVPDPPRPESSLAALDAIGQSLRTGRLPHAVLALQGVDASARPLLDELLERLEAEGFVDEVGVLRLCVRQPTISRSLRSARVASIGLALFVAGVLGLFGGGPLVLIPALAVLYVTGELMRVLLFRPILRSMSSAERRLVQGLLDVSTFHSDDTTVTQFGGWLFAGMGVNIVGADRVPQRASIG